MLREKGNDYEALSEEMIYAKGQKKVREKSMEKNLI